MIRPNNEELQRLESDTKIHGIKLILNCKKCNRRWSIWFENESDLLNHLPENWHVCSSCKWGEPNGK
mgnify:CR=1 FL=1